MEYILFFAALTVAVLVTILLPIVSKGKINKISDRLSVIPLVVFFVLRFFAVNRSAFLSGFINLKF